MNVEPAQTCPDLRTSIRPPSKREIIEAIKALSPKKFEHLPFCNG
jgi:hypothetical protein